MESSSKTDSSGQLLKLWLPYRRPVPRPRLRLFCFPYAGGSASVFRTWGEHLPQEVEICAVQLPGRERRFKEKAFLHMGDAVPAIATVLRPLLDLPFALAGHSLGARMAYDLALALRDLGGPEPVHLSLSGGRAPHVPGDYVPFHKLGDAELIEAIRDLEGTPSEALDHAELMELLLPLLRADFELIETCVYQPREPLAASLSAFGGADDRLAWPASVEAWRRYTQGSFRCRIFQGGHFFLNDDLRSFLAELRRDLTAYL